MSVVIEGYDKPKSCLSCPFNRDDCWCSITHGEIDRDYYDCDKPCPIKPLDNVLDEIRAEIPKLTCGDNEYRQALVKVADVIKCIDRHKFDGHKEEENGEED